MNNENVKFFRFYSVNDTTHMYNNKIFVDNGVCPAFNGWFSVLEYSYWKYNKNQESKNVIHESLLQQINESELIAYLLKN